MTTFHRHHRGGRRGFTLLELLAVVMIIGIVAAILLPRVALSTDTAKEKMRDHHLAGLNRMVELYHMQQGVWPSALADLVPGYLPDGLPTPPQGGGYVLDGVTHRVSHSP